MAGPQPELMPTSSGTMQMSGSGQAVIYATDPALLSAGPVQGGMDGSYYNTARIILHPPAAHMQSPAVLQTGPSTGPASHFIALQRSGTPGMHQVMQQTMPMPIPSYSGGYSSQQPIPAANPGNNGMTMYPSPLRTKTSETRPRGGSFRKSCNCKNSRCLKLYCECFASGRYCDTCNCVNCYNNKSNEQTRQSAVEAILERNPNAFRPKIQGEEQAAQQARAAENAAIRHTKGCNCKKSNCLKKYCECFQAGIHCSDNCKCMDCKNFEGSEARAMVIASQDGAPTAAALHQAMPSPSPAKRSRLLAPVQQHSYPVVMQQNILPSGLMPPQAAMMHTMPQAHTPAARPNTPAAAPLTSTHTPRSTAKEVVHKVVERDMITQLCSLLVLVSGKASEAAMAEQQQRQQEQGQPQGEGQQMGEGQRGGGSQPAHDSMEDSDSAPSTTGPLASGVVARDGTTAGRPSEDPGGGTDTNLSPSEGYIYQSQEKAVLEEFKSILLKIIDTTQSSAPDSIPIPAQSTEAQGNHFDITNSPQSMPYVLYQADGMGPGRPHSMPLKRNLHGLQSLNLHQKLQLVLHDKNEVAGMWPSPSAMRAFPGDPNSPMLGALPQPLAQTPSPARPTPQYNGNLTQWSTVLLPPPPPAHVPLTLILHGEFRQPRAYAITPRLPLVDLIQQVATQLPEGEK